MTARQRTRADRLSGKTASASSAVTLAAALLAGCGAGTPPVPTTTITTVVTSTSVSISVTVTTSVQVSVSLAAPVGLDTAGPEGGTACSADPSYFDEAPTGLEPEAIAAWQSAKTAGAAAGVTLCLNDGKRSVAQQEQTYTSYVAQYGESAANQLVLPPEKSAHVLGYAVDVQPSTAAAWLEGTGGRLGWCRMYDNEAWHFEYAQTFTLGCPPRRPKPAG